MKSTNTSTIQMKGERKDNHFFCHFTLGFDKSHTATKGIPTDEIISKIVAAEKLMEPGDIIQIDFKIKYGSPKKTLTPNAPPAG